MNSRYSDMLIKGILFSGLFLLTPSKIYASNGYAGGSGTANDPFLISTAEHLNQLQLDVNVNYVDTTGKYYKLTSDIDLSNYDNDDNVGNGNLTPIGTSVVPFKGNFDGDGHVISNLKIVLQSKQYVGLFGHIDSATVQRVGLEDITLEGYYYVGGIAGKQTGGTISQSYTTGSVVNNGNDTGGLVGTQYDDGRISQSYSTASVSSTGFYTGGLVGNQNFGGITECYATGKVSGSDAGGLTGNTLSRSSGGSAKVPKPSLGTVLDSYWDTQTTNSSNSGGGVGLTSDEMTGEAAKTNMDGFDFNSAWRVTNSYPELTWQTASSTPSLPSTPPTTSEKVIQITGEVLPLVASITVPTETLSFVIDPNQEPDKQFIAPEFSVTNNTYAPLKLEIKSFNQLTSGMKDVLPSKYSNWNTLNKTESNDIALAVVPQKGDGWKSLTEGARYVADNSNYELGVINPAETVNFKFSALHGRTIIKPISLSYELTLIFDFE